MSTTRGGMMRGRLRAAALTSACLITLGAACSFALGGAQAQQSQPQVQLDFYSAQVSASQYADLLAEGYDVSAARDVGDRKSVDLVLSPEQVKKLHGKGVKPEVKRNKFGRTAVEEAARQAAAGYTVWHEYDGPDGLRAELEQIARDHADIAELETLGTTGEGRPIYALRLSKGQGNKPAVLFSAGQHAREWIAPETDMRILRSYVNAWDAKDKTVRKVLEKTELWFVPVMNPDGYQYTFASPDTRLWRKNLRDNDGNGTIEVGDGVDPNRNYPEHWRYDDEGSSSTTSSDTYRGPSAASEPETQAMMKLLDRVHFAFQVNFHSYGPYLLYPEGWQIGTPSGDDPIYYALSGNFSNPAIPGFYPGVSSDVLYVTNGESTDFSHLDHGTLAWTPELDEGCTGCGFVFPDDESLVQGE